MKTTTRWINTAVRSVLFVGIPLVSYLVYQMIPQNQLVIRDQPIDSAIRIKKVRVREDAVLVIFQSSISTQTIAEPNALMPDVYRDISIPLDPIVDTQIKSGYLFIAELRHIRDELREIDDTSQVLRDIWGRPVRVFFRALSSSKTGT